jgi:hypothetical protein
MEYALLSAIVGLVALVLGAGGGLAGRCFLPIGRGGNRGQQSRCRNPETQFSQC